MIRLSAIHGRLITCIVLTVGTLVLMTRSQAPVSPDACFSHPDRGHHLILALDTSGSEGDALGPNVIAAARLAMRLDPQHDVVTAYSLDHDTTELTDRCAPASAETFQQTLVTQLGGVPPKGGTFPDRFWTVVCRARSGKHAPAAVALWTDGDIDDMSPQALHTMRASARQLGSDPRLVCVCFYGVHRENRDRLRALFAPLGDRLHLYEPGVTDIDSLAAALQSAPISGR